jgi:hypothetical protein
MSTISRLLESVPIPRLVPVRQSYERPRLADPGASFVSALRSRGVLDRIEDGHRIAIAVGSRGVENLPLFVKLTVEEIRRSGGKPFIFPAMGSHGGATAEGQKSLLEGMGVTEETVGAPIRATMEVVQIGTSENGLPVYLDKFADEADGIVLINRVKPHVGFRGPFESGIMKMIAIGVGKQKGAETCHNLGFGTMAENLPAIGRVFLEKRNLLWATALVENAYHETCMIEVLKSAEIEDREPALQQEAKRLSPRLHFPSLDVLILDEIGKDISGTGFDTNVVGRFHTPYASGGPDITRMAVLDLTEKSHGNANGVGILDFTTRRLFDKMDFEQTYPNSLTSTVPTSVKVPMVLHNDREAIQAAIKTCNISDVNQVRLVRMKNTLSTDRIWASETLLAEIASHDSLEIDGAPACLEFDAEGNLF